VMPPREAWDCRVRALAPLPAIDRHPGDAANAFLADPIAAVRDIHLFRGQGVSDYDPG